MKGIIYKYTSPSGKVYIGQTINEKGRRYQFKVSKFYGGGKINNARNKYGAENFTYEVLKEIELDDIDKLNDLLDQYEIEYINFYDSYKNGYNSTEGGGGAKGCIRSEETKAKLSLVKQKENNPFYGLKHSDETKKKMSDNNGAKWACVKPILQYTKTGEFVKEFTSLQEASEEINKVPTAIGNCLKGRSKTCAGFTWKYKN